MNKVTESKFAAESRPVLKKLLDRLLGEFDYASILAVDSEARTYTVTRKNMSVNEDSLLTQRGFVAKVSDGKHYGEYSFNFIEEGILDDICGKIRETMEAGEKVLPEGLGMNQYLPPQEEKTVFYGSTDYETDPREMGDDAILEHLSRLKDRGLSMSSEILDCQARCEYQKYTKLFLSKDKDLTQNVMWMNGVIAVAAARGEEIKYCGRPCSCLGGAELLSQMENEVEEAVNVALQLLQSEPVVPGEYECVCAPEVTGLIVHEAFGHGVEMDMFVKDRALAANFIDQYTASPLVTMHDGAAAVPESATYFFDDEGTMAHDTVIIEKGVLKRGISDLQSALILGKEPTGNGRRESYRRKAYTRMTNTYFEGGEDSPEDLIASISYGFLLEEASSGMEDPKNWGIQCMTNIAREIRDGRLTGRIFSPVVMTGYVPDLLKSISGMSREIRLSGTGFCGKGYKEWVKVSDGGPYIKARIRLG